MPKTSLKPNRTALFYTNLRIIYTYRAMSRMNKKVIFHYRFELPLPLTLSP